MKILTSKEHEAEKQLTVPKPERLPYAFDLLYDLKTMKDVEDVAYGRPSRCNVTPRELAKVFLDYNIPIPKCLAHVIDERYAKEREVEKQPIAPEPYQHPLAIKGHVYRITNSRDGSEVEYFAVRDLPGGNILLYSLDTGEVWNHTSTFGVSADRWKDITARVYLNTDGLEEMK